MDTPSLQLLKQRLAAYRRKYYANQMLRGGILFALLATSLLVLFILFEGTFWLSSGWRAALFYTLVGSGLAVLGRYVAYPAAKYFGLAETISDREAARLIGRHFPEVEDRLVNLLELSDLDAADNSLLTATIEQRTHQLEPIPILSSISFRPNWRLARYIVAPLAILILLLVISPELVTQGAVRLVNYEETYVPPPPFEVQYDNAPDRLVDGSSHELSIKLSGDELPAELFMFIRKENHQGFQRYTLKRKNSANYRFTFKNVHQDFSFYVGNERHGSNQRQVEVLKQPAVGQFFVTLDYPAYTSRPTDTLAPNVGDLSALYGTRATWHVNFRGPVDEARFRQRFSDSAASAEQQTIEGQSLTQSLQKPFAYQFILRSDADVPNADTVAYNVDVTPDQHPSVTIRRPSMEAGLPSTGILPLEVDYQDDYGFTRAKLYYRFLESNDPGKADGDYQTEFLPLTKQGTAAQTIDRMDFIEMGASQGDIIEFYVRIWDNDQLRGPKATSSVLHKVVYQSLQKKYDELNETSESISSGLSKSAKEARELTKKFEENRRKLLDKKRLSYEDRKEFESLMKQQEEMRKRMQQMSQQLGEQIQKAEQDNLLTPETREKLEQLKKIMKKSADNELLERLRELQEKLDNMNRRQLQNQTEKMEKESERMKNDIERTLELFKQLQADQKVQELMQRLGEMEKRQEMLKDKLDATETPESLEKLKKKQQELGAEMNEMKKGLKELEDLKKQTNTPQKGEMDKLGEQADETQQEMKGASEEMQQMQQQQQGGQQPNSSGAKQKQQNAKQNLQQMQESLSQMQLSAEMQQAQENYEDLRALLENLLKLSFDQEELRNDMRGLKRNDPSVRKFVRKQNNITSDFEMVKDSLTALAKRSIQIKDFVLDQVDDVDHSMDRTLRFFDDHRIPMGNSEQHKAMTGLNRLANLLVESLQNMQANMNQMKGQSGMCKKPGSGQPSLSEISKMQQKLNEEMQRMQEQMKKGNKPGQKGKPKDQGKGQKKGKQGQKGQQGRMKEFAKEQEQIRQQLQELYEKLREQNNKGLGDLGKVTDDMKDAEEELRNKQLSEELLRRQQRILNRLLDYDKAMREREFDNKRKAETADDDYRKIRPDQLAPNELEQRIRREQFNQTKYRYAPGYRELIERYYQLLETQDHDNDTTSGERPS